MNTAENIFLPTPVTAADITGFKAAAVTEYANAKSNAMKSAANAYLVWHHGESANALPEMRSWIDGEIAKANEKIDAHNKAVEHKKDRAKLCHENKLNEVISDAEKVELLGMYTWKSHQWAREKQVKIDGRTGSSTYTRIVKYVFGFNKPSDASHVSRYAKALEFIEQSKAELNGDFTVDAIVRLLEKAGGFEAAVEAVRGAPTGKSDNVRVATLKKIKQVVSGIDTGDEIVFAPKHDNDGYVFLVGRTTATGVMICGELAINDNEEADALLLKIDGGMMGDPPPAVEFVSRVASIAQLIHEGRDSHLTDTVGTGKKFKVARAFSLLKHGASTQIVVSARYAEASIVVHAHPKGNVAIGSLEQGQAAMLDADTASALTKHLRDPARCRLMTFEAVQADDTVPVRWEISTDMGESAETIGYNWKPMLGQMHLPLNIRGYEPECAVTLTHSQLRDLHDNELVKWTTAKSDDKKAKKPLTVELDGETLTVGNTAFGYYRLPLGGRKGAHVSLTLRPRDLLDLCKSLIANNVTQCSLSGDNNGMLAINWEDNVGTYSVFVPVVEARGNLSKACLGYIKPIK